MKKRILNNEIPKGIMYLNGEGFIQVEDTKDLSADQEIKQRTYAEDIEPLLPIIED